MGDVNNIIARSQLEIKFFTLCDNNSEIIKWSSECVFCYYISPLDNKPHRYFIDLFIQNDKGDKYLVEIKPYSQTIPPRKTQGKREKTLLNEVKTYAVNKAKWDYADAFAQKQGCKFIILTEKDLK
jgi:hypothetical protein